MKLQPECPEVQCTCIEFRTQRKIDTQIAFLLSGTFYKILQSCSNGAYLNIRNLIVRHEV